MHVILRLVSLVFQLILSNNYGAVGCAIAVGAANIIGQGIILNWYYYSRQNLNIIKFWKEIGKMTIVPASIAVVGYFIINEFTIDSWLKFILAVVCIMVLYIPLVWKFGMNESERLLFSRPLQRIKNKLL